jgi:hypothetical protein
VLAAVDRGATRGVGVGVVTSVSACGACGAGAGATVLGIASTNGAAAGSALAEFRNPPRPDQLSANAVNTTTTMAKATKISVERRDHRKTKLLNTGTGYFKSVAMQVGHVTFR